MNGFWGNSEKVVDLFKEHNNKVDECLNKFVQVIELYINEGESEAVKNLSKEIHELETDADGIRREIIHFMIKERFLLPNTRRDFLNLLELLDKVADYSEAGLDYLILQSMDITNIGKDKLKEMLDLTYQQYQLMKRAVDYLFTNIDRAYELVARIEEIESQVDVIERTLISRLSDRDDLGYGLKVLYRDFVTMIANISDVIEDAGDEIELIIAMRKV